MAGDIIFAPLDGTNADARALAAAQALADRLDARIDAVFVGRDDAAALVMSADGFLGVGAAAIESLREERRRGEAAARAAASQAPRAAFRVHAGPRALASHAGRLALLAALDPVAAGPMGGLLDILEQLLIEDGAAVLLPRAPAAPRRAAVAWDGSREAARALKASAPLLGLLGEAVVLQAAHAIEARDAGAADPAYAEAWLTRRGLAAQRVMIEAGGDPGRALLAAARDAGADLLIAGAYGHARLREAVLGGVTRTLLAAETGPSLLLAH